MSIGKKLLPVLCLVLAAATVATIYAYTYSISPGTKLVYAQPIEKGKIKIIKKKDNEIVFKIGNRTFTGIILGNITETKVKTYTVKIGDKNVIIKVALPVVIKVDENGHVQITYAKSEGYVKVGKLPQNVRRVDISKYVGTEAIVPISGRLEPGEGDLYYVGVLSEGESVTTRVVWYPGNSYLWIALCNLRTGICAGYVKHGGSAVVTLSAWSPDPYAVLVYNLGPYTAYYWGYIKI